jgi:type II secretory pathway pseudopilin PulG
MLNLAKKNKGITLIEILVTILVSTILFAMVASIFYSFTTLYNRLDRQNQVMNELLVVKSTISITLDENNSNSLDIHIRDNSILINDVNVYIDNGGLFKKIGLNDPVRLSSSSMIKNINFQLNSAGTLIKCSIEYKLDEESNNIYNYSFAKALRCK